MTWSLLLKNLNLPGLGEFIGIWLFQKWGSNYSKGKGEKGGARLITLVKIQLGIMFIYWIFMINQVKESISIQELKFLFIYWDKTLNNFMKANLKSSFQNSVSFRSVFHIDVYYFPGIWSQKKLI